MAPPVKGTYNLRIREPQRKYNLRMREPVVQDERHPDLGRFDRSRALELSPEDQQAFLEQQGFEAQRQPDETVNIRKKGEQDWKKLDPSRFELFHDTVDIIPMVGQMASAGPATGASAATGAALGTPLGPIGTAVGGAIGGAIGFGAHMAGTEALKQGALKATGAPVSLKGATSRALEEGAYGAAGELGGRALIGAGKAAYGAAKGVAGAVKGAAREVPYSAREFSDAIVKHGRPVAEEAGKRFGLDPADMAKMGDNELAVALEKNQPGGAFRERGIVEQSGKMIDESQGGDLDIVTRRRHDKLDNFDRETVVAQKGDIRRFPQAQYGPYQGTVLSKEQVREGAREISPTDLRAWIQKEFGEARPIVVKRYGRTQKGLPTKRAKEVEVSLNQMNKSEMIDFIFENQKGKTTLPFGTSRAKDLEHDLRTVVERNTPHLEMGRSWREVNLRDVESIKAPQGALDFTRPSVRGKFSRMLMGARGPLKRDLMGATGEALKSVGKAAQWPIRAARRVAGVGPGGGYLVGGLGVVGNVPLAGAAVKAGLGGAVLERLGEVLARDTGNLGSQLLAHADLPIRAARRIKAALDALQAKGVDAYRLSMQAIARDPEFREWVESKA